jgi:DNA-binding CsgD family transcriptional regulator
MMSELQFDDVIASIYDAIFAPEVWPSALTQVGRAVGAPNASLGLLLGPELELDWVIVKGVARPGAVPSQNLFHRYDVVAHLLKTADFGYFDSTTAAERLKNDRPSLYTELDDALGSTSFLGCHIKLDYGGSAILLLETDHGRLGSINNRKHLLTDVTPHLARALNITIRLDKEFERSLIDAYGHIGLPAGIFSETHGTILSANALFNRFGGTSSHLLDSSTKAAPSLQSGPDFRVAQALSAYVQQRRGNSHFAQDLIPVTKSRELPPLLIHVIRDGSMLKRYISCSDRALFVVSAVTASAVPSADIVQSLFDLTPAEARVARGIAMGETVEEIATQAGVAIGTVRFHLKGVFTKSSLGRQAELVSRLSGLCFNQKNQLKSLVLAKILISLEDLSINIGIIA